MWGPVGRKGTGIYQELSMRLAVGSIWALCTNWHFLLSSEIRGIWRGRVMGLGQPVFTHWNKISSQWPELMEKKSHLGAVAGDLPRQFSFCERGRSGKQRCGRGHGGGPRSPPRTQPPLLSVLAEGGAVMRSLGRCQSFSLAFTCCVFFFFLIHN